MLVRASTRFVCIALVALLCAHAASATNYFVRTKGSDSNAGTSAAAAFKTVQKALSVAQAGDTIYIGKGTFNAGVSSVRSGTSAGKIFLQGDTTGAYTGDKGTPLLTTSSGTTVTITHDNIEFQQVNINGNSNPVTWSGNNGALRTVTINKAAANAVNVTGGSLLLATCKIYNGSADAVHVTGAGSVTLNACTIYKNSGRGLAINGATAKAVVDRNTFYNNDSYTIELQNGSLTLTNNLIRGTSNGVRIAAGSAQVWNNTIANAGTYGVVHAGGSLTLFNNIINQVSNGLSYTGGSLSHNNNLYWANTTNYVGVAAASSDLAADPKFSSKSNWKLQSTSPAIDVGASGAAVTRLDRNGGLRPTGGAYDIGAYEVAGPASKVPYFADFESTSTPGAEWTIASSAALKSTQSTRFAGPFANSSVGLRLTTTPEVDYTLIFDVYFLNTWDGSNVSYGPDYFGVSVNGDTALRSTYAWPNYGFPWTWPDMPESWRSPFTGISSQIGVFRSVVVDFTAEDAVTFITFFGENLQGWSDEGWGIDNVRVVTADNAAPHRPAFVEVGRLQGFDQVVSAGEAAGLFWADFNDDGLLDVIQGGGATSRLSLNTGGSYASTAFTNFVRQGAIADFNSDGTLDFWGIGPKDALTLMTGIGEGAFTTSATGITKTTNNEALAAADLNGDGLCDLALFSGNGNWAVLSTPQSISKGDSVISASARSAGVSVVSSPGQSATASGQVKKTLAAALPSSNWTLSSTVFPTSAIDAGDGNFCSSADVNNDGYLDFFYHYSTGRLFLSNADGTYDSDSRGIKVTTGESDKMGSVWGDFNNDGNADLFVACRKSAACSLWINPGPTGNFANVAAAKGIAPPSGVVGCDFGDYDNDGNLDLYLTLTSGQGMLYRNQGAPSYSFVAMPLGGASVETLGGDVCFVDTDNDGNLDLATTSESSSYPSLLFANQNVSNQYLKVRVLGTGSGGINRAGVGTRVELWDAANKKFVQRREIGLAKGYAGQSPLWVQFGGIKPDSLYTLRVFNGPKSYVVPNIQPSAVTSTVGDTDIPQMYTFDESKFHTGVRIVRWREQGPDE